MRVLRVISVLALDRAMITLGAAAASVLAELQGVQIVQIEYGAIRVIGGLAVFVLARGFRSTVAGSEDAAAPRAAEARPSPGLADAAGAVLESGARAQT